MGVEQAQQFAACIAAGAGDATLSPMTVLTIVMRSRA